MNVDIIELMSCGESQTVEFLSEKVNPLALAKVISAFANTDGGVILLGVNDSSTIGGVEPVSAITLIERALKMLSSSDAVTFDIQEIRIVLNVAVIQVNKSNQLVFCDSGAYIRDGEKIRVMHQEEIRAAIGSSGSSLESLSAVLEKQTLIIESLEKTINCLRSEIAEGNSLKSKIKDHLLGATLGGFVGIVVGAIGF